MLLSGHQPNYLPYPGFFHKMLQADKFVIVDNTQFVKRGPFGWIHRNRIRTRDGWMWLTVPVLTKGKFTQKINETLIDNKLPWQRKHWKSIEIHYARAPFFRRYQDPLREVYERKWENLAELNTELIRRLMDLLEIRKELRIASREGIEGRSTDLVIDMCRKMGADAYLSGVHGQDYLQQEKFRAAGIRLVFQKFDPPQYSQCQPGPFVPNLSIIDLIFNCGPESGDILRRSGEAC